MNNQILILTVIVVIGYIVAHLSFKYDWKFKEWF